LGYDRVVFTGPYVHVVACTLPHGLLPLAYRNSARLYTWLFQGSAATLRLVGAISLCRLADFAPAVTLVHEIGFRGSRAPNGL